MHQEPPPPVADVRGFRRPISVAHARRLVVVLELIRRLAARSVLDFGCGDGALLEKLVLDRSITALVGVDESSSAIEGARSHLTTALARRYSGATTVVMRAADAELLRGFDVVVAVEVVEHIPRADVDRFAGRLFEAGRHVILTTPNRDWNICVNHPLVRGLRHVDHCFEFGRSEFENWAARFAVEHGRVVGFEHAGAEYKGERPTLIAVFSPAPMPSTTRH